MQGAIRARAALACLLLVALAVAAAGCGSGGSPSTPPAPTTSTAEAKATAPTASAHPQNATLILDFTPNAVHTGIYAALARHYDRDVGVNLHVIAPTATTDSIKLLETGKVDFAILDIHDLAIADQSAPTHPRLVGIMAVVERPLAAVIAAPGVSSPKALEGKTVGITGVPSDTAVLRSEVIGSGGDPAKVKTITIGFNAVADLLAGRVAAALAFWNDEGVTIRSKRPGFHVFRVDEYGAPSYPELVVCATAQTLRRDPGLARGVVDALVRGYDYTLGDPEQAAQDLDRQVAGLDPKLVGAQLAGLLPSFKAPDGHVGELDRARLDTWAGWEARFGIVSRPPDVDTIFDPDFVASSAAG
ncbi:MAG TPA: ABC transporter substrate-binding protein [Solirubrobacteraceae bacterium]|nr:ABC transporter substrate-binding protein [Solirubrobacteraceae bacterium]